MGAFLSRADLEKVSQDGSSSAVEYGVTGMQGWRANMEDAHSVELDVADGTSIFGVFDGHGGAEVSRLCSERLPRVLMKTCQALNGNVARSVVGSFMEMDNYMRSEVGSLKLGEYAREDRERLLRARAHRIEEEVQGYQTSGEIPAALVDAGLGPDQLAAVLGQAEAVAAGAGGGGPGAGARLLQQEEEEEEEVGATASGFAEVPVGVVSVDAATEQKAADAVVDSEEDEEDIDVNGDDGSSEAVAVQDVVPTPDAPTGLRRSPRSPPRTDAKHGHSSDSGVVREVYGNEGEGEGEGNEDFDDDDDDDDCSPPGYGSGCTANVTVLQDDLLICGNAGDSRCIMSRQGMAVDLSQDHKPRDQKETDRIVRAGAVVDENDRVNGGLNLSRAIGDLQVRTDET